MKKKSIHQFVKENRKEIDTEVHKLLPSAKLNDEARRLWVVNHEGLYNLARSKGVEV